jgi:hypothetical protein
MKAFLPSDIPAARAELHRQRARDFINVCRSMALFGDSAHHVERLPNNVRIAIRAAISPGVLGTEESLHELAALSRGWLATLREGGGSCFDRLLPAMRPAPLLMRFAVSTQTLVFDLLDESQAKPTAALNLSSSDAIMPRKVAAISVLSDELAKLSEALQLLDVELRAGVSRGVDGVFLNELYEATTPTASAGSSAANTITDVSALLDAVPLGPTSRPHFIFSPAAAKKLATKHVNGVFTWPRATPTGGFMLDIPLVVSDRLPSGAALLVDASMIAANAGEVAPMASRQADIQLLDADSLDSSPEAEDVYTSLWMHNMVGVRIERTFAFKVLRSTAVASLSGVDY